MSQTYPLIELANGDSNQLGLPVTLQLEEARLVLDDLAQEEGKELFVVTRLREVLAEALNTHARQKKKSDETDAGEGKSAQKNARVAVSF